MVKITLARLVACIKIGIGSRHSVIKGPRNNFSIKCLTILYQLGYIRGFTVVGPHNVVVYLRYTSNNKSALRQLTLISRPSRKIYFSKANVRGAGISNFMYTNSFIICSTSRGLFTDVETIMLGHGGEPILYVA